MGDALGVAGIAAIGRDAGSDELAEDARVAHVVPQCTVAAVGGPLLADVVVHLGVDGVTVKEESAAGEEVTVEVVCSDARKLSGDDLRNIGNARHRYGVVSKWCSTTTSYVSGRRIVDRASRRFGRRRIYLERLSKVTSVHSRSGHCAVVIREFAARGCFIGTKEEQLVLDDRTADRSAGLIEDVLRIAVVLLVQQRKSEGLGQQLVVVVVPESRAVKGVGAALDLHVDRCATGEALFG